MQKTHIIIAESANKMLKYSRNYHQSDRLVLHIGSSPSIYVSFTKVYCSLSADIQHNRVSKKRA